MGYSISKPTAGRNRVILDAQPGGTVTEMFQYVAPQPCTARVRRVAGSTFKVGTLWMTCGEFSGASLLVPLESGQEILHSVDGGVEFLPRGATLDSQPDEETEEEEAEGEEPTLVIGSRPTADSLLGVDLPVDVYPTEHPGLAEPAPNTFPVFGARSFFLHLGT